MVKNELRFSGSYVNGIVKLRAGRSGKRERAGKGGFAELVFNEASGTGS